MAYRRRVRLRGPWALAVGVVCLGIGFYQFLVSRDLQAHGLIAQARVVDVDSRRVRKSGGFRGREYALTLEYTDRAGARHRERTGYRKSYSRHARGDRVEIRYNPNRPTEFAVDTFQGLWLGPIGFGAIGILACGAFLYGPRRTGG